MPKSKPIAKQRKEHDHEVTRDLLTIASSLTTKLEKEVSSDAESLSLFPVNEFKTPRTKTHRKTPKRESKENTVQCLVSLWFCYLILRFE